MINAIEPLNFTNLYFAEKARRKAARLDKLQAARPTFRPGVRVRLKNGITGVVSHAMKTRFKVLADNGGKWNCPPSCMTVI